ncbi:Transcriptional regulatory protein tctD [Aliarcobacter thereius]|uniref:Response regulator n=2 Tax=Arcobacteraceae TaxID=2808963 RepID=A0A1C0B6M7_9BACT|nr:MULTISPECIES: response regulator [Arcobacteraceae]OCL86714.1 Transcriptional regulatory protein tctD [Aliarcobacter thereius]OCL86789.1 Transcriptional regulatory protein tctD [Aliarcobacter thereius]OCL90991.1 Transcriptional regulatory protein tctD [Aliarcobacter thereius]OCL98958.1 Transcriptional regulatory protein tctD [Aliarcobacter thereius]QEP40774.1 two-component system response regulator [Arcobacter porcinus]
MFKQGTELLKNKKLNLLYAEDDLELRDKVVYFIKDKFENIYLASDGIDALEIYNKKIVDIIITDISMPKLTGIDLIKEIRKKDNKIPIIIITAQSDKKSLLEAIPLNLVRYIVKPFEITKNNLINVIDESIIRIKSTNNIEEFNLTEEIVYDYINKKFIFNNKKEKALTQNETLLFELLLENRNNLVSFEVIENSVFSDSIMTDSSLKNLLLRLRKKLTIDIIKTVRGLGILLQIDR